MFRSKLSRTIHASPTAVWDALIDTSTWPEWGPVIADVDYEPGKLVPDTDGRLFVLPGIWVPFHVTTVSRLPNAEWEWGWRFGPVPAAAHRVSAQPDKRGSSVVTFDTPGWFPSFYAFTWLALANLDTFVSGGK